MQRGLFIAVEGIDGSGKTTVIKMLKESMEKLNIPVVTMAFPNRSTFSGKKIDAYLKGGKDIEPKKLAYLFSKNRREEEPGIRRALFQGKIVIVDRYGYSGIAYGVVSSKGLVSAQDIMEMDKGLPRPDYVFYLNCDPEIALSRRSGEAERYEKLEFQQKVAQEFERVSNQVPPKTWHIVNASKTPDEVLKQIQDHLKDPLKITAPIEGMWGKKDLYNELSKKQKTEKQAEENPMLPEKYLQAYNLIEQHLSEVVENPEKVSPGSFWVRSGIIEQKCSSGDGRYSNKERDELQGFIPQILRYLPYDVESYTVAADHVFFKDTQTMEVTVDFKKKPRVPAQ